MTSPSGFWLQTHRVGLRRLAVGVVAIYVLYLIAANVFLNSALGERAFNQRPERFQIHWTRAMSLYPGHVHCATCGWVDTCAAISGRSRAGGGWAHQAVAVAGAQVELRQDPRARCRARRRSRRARPAAVGAASVEKREAAVAAALRCDHDRLRAAAARRKLVRGRGWRGEFRDGQGIARRGSRGAAVVAAHAGRAIAAWRYGAGARCASRLLDDDGAAHARAGAGVRTRALRRCAVAIDRARAGAGGSERSKDGALAFAKTGQRARSSPTCRSAAACCSPAVACAGSRRS